MTTSKYALTTDEGIRERMHAAIDVARHGIFAGQAPFGAAIFGDQGQLIAAEHNQVRELTDPTAHAEVLAIRSACHSIGKRNLAGCWLFATCEPCPMCASAAVFAGLRHVVYGASVDDARDAGFTELQLPSSQIFDQSGVEMNVFPGVGKQDCCSLLSQQC